MKNRFAIFGFVVLSLLCFAAFLAPLISPFNFDVQDVNRVLLSPNKINWFGTDELGRDLFSRVIYGARVSLTIGFVTASIAVFIGIIYGAFAGYFGGVVDALMMRVTDVILSIPPLVLMILVSVIFNAFSFFSSELIRAIGGMVFALSLSGWVSVARLVRAQVLQMKEMPFVFAAQASGAGFKTIIIRHILPNISGSIIVVFTFLIPTQILHESFLSFIGLGLQPPYSSWGVLANEGWRSFRTYPHLILFPGGAIFITMLACQFLGDGLRDILDPQSHYGHAE